MFDAVADSPQIDHPTRMPKGYNTDKLFQDERFIPKRCHKNFSAARLDFELGSNFEQSPDSDHTMALK